MRRDGNTPLHRRDRATERASRAARRGPRRKCARQHLASGGSDLAVTHGKSARPIDVTTNTKSEKGLARRSTTSLAADAGESALQAYMREIGRHPVISAEEQLAFARELGRTADPQLAARLVTTNLRLVVKMARELRKGDVPLLDLIQEGNLGLMHAVRKFDPEKGVKLTSYAAWWIRAYILKTAMRDARLVRLGTSQTQRKLFFNLRKETARLEVLGLDTSAEALAARLEVPVQEVIEMRDRLSRRDVSLDARDGLVQASVRAFGETLSGRDRVVFERRMLAEEPMTLRELGATLNISRERARQLEKAIAKKLERALRAVVPIEMLAA